MLYDIFLLETLGVRAPSQGYWYTTAVISEGPSGAQLALEYIIE